MENNQIKELGNKLTELRKNKGLTQTELAEEMFITHQAISQWENGLTIPDLGSLLKLCEIFNITLNDLFYQKKEETKEEVHQMPNDNVIRIFAVKNGKVLKHQEVKPLIKVQIIFEEKIEGSVDSDFSVTAKDIGGNVTAGSYVECENVEGSICSGSYVECGEVGQNVTAGSYVECSDVSGNVASGSYVECGNVGKDLKAASYVECGDVGGNVTTMGNIECHTIYGNASANKINM